jgi:hypothetical protein
VSVLRIRAGIGKIRNTKHEIRNNREMTKIQMTETNSWQNAPVWVIGKF